jgi:hypothetical protein
MGETEGWKFTVLLGEAGQSPDAAYNPGAYDKESFPVLDQVRVVSDEGAGGSQVDDSPGRGGDIAEEMYVGHDVMTKAPFVLRSLHEVQLLQAGLHLLNGLLCDRESHLPFGLGQRHPEPTPGPESMPRGENLQHLLGGIAVCKGMDVTAQGVLFGHVVIPV